MDTLGVYAYESETDENHFCGSLEIPQGLTNEAAILIGKGMAYEASWIPESVWLTIIRGTGAGETTIYDGL